MFAKFTILLLVFPLQINYILVLKSQKGHQLYPGGCCVESQQHLEPEESSCGWYLFLSGNWKELSHKVFSYAVISVLSCLNTETLPTSRIYLTMLSNKKSSNEHIYMFWKQCSCSWHPEVLPKSHPLLLITYHNGENIYWLVLLSFFSGPASFVWELSGHE